MLDYPACTIPCPGMHSASCRSRHSSSEGERLQLSGGLFKKKIRWLRAGNCIVPKKKDYFSYILKKKILLPERGGSAQERFFFPRSSSTSERGRTHGIRAVRPLCWAIRFLFPDGGPTGSPDSRQRVRVFFPSLLQLVSRVA